MENIVLNDGKKAYTINENENKVIRFNPCDFGIVTRIGEMLKDIEKLKKKNETSKTQKDILKLDEYIKKQINYVFNADIADIVFDGTHPLTLIDGIPYYQHFIDAIIPIIQTETEKEKKASRERIEKYTKKYESK